MPALPVSVMEPLWAPFVALLPDHPLGCHRRRIPDRVVVEHVVDAVVHGSGYERIASPGCSDRAIRRRVHAWAAAGLTEQLHTLALAQYDRLIRLELTAVCVDGCITKAPGGGERAGRSPVDRGKQGRSLIHIAGRHLRGSLVFVRDGCRGVAGHHLANGQLRCRLS